MEEMPFSDSVSGKVPSSLAQDRTSGSSGDLVSLLCLDSNAGAPNMVTVKSQDMQYKLQGK